MTLVVFTPNGALMVRRGYEDVPLRDWPHYKREVRAWLQEQQLSPRLPIRLELTDGQAAALLARLGLDARTL